MHLISSHFNQVKNCMEAGQTVVLLHLDEIYESLYDMLNQQYTKVRVGFGRIVAS